MKEIADAASCGRVEKTLVVQRLGGLVPWSRGRDKWFHDAIASATPMRAIPLDPEAPLLIAYTSGTTGRPKGVVHVHGGFLVKVTEEFAYQLDVHPGDRLHWVADMGWIVGPWQATAVGCLGATLVLHEGAPDHPAPDRLWRLVERHGITCLGLSPTLVRALRARGDQFLDSHDRSSSRILATTGSDTWRRIGVAGQTSGSMGTGPGEMRTVTGTSSAAPMTPSYCRQPRGPFRPAKVWFVEALPKTRSAKVPRRVIQAVACRHDPGDLSSLEDPATLDAIRAAN